MKTKLSINISLLTLLVSLLVVSNCSKEDDDQKHEKENIFYLEASIDTPVEETKTSYSYSNKILKTTWKSGDKIAVLGDNGVVVRFSAGLLLDNGRTARFTSSSSVSHPQGNIIAVYPYTSDLYYTLENCGARDLERLADIDILLARAFVEDTNKISLVFSPLCTILRFRKGMQVSKESNTVHYTLHGDNVANKLSFSESGEISLEKGEISFSLFLSGGRLTEDKYIAFFPLKNEGAYIYYLDSDKGDHFEFFKKDIYTNSIYSINTSTSEFVDFKDDTFRQYCLDNFDVNKDQQISYAEAKSATSIDLHGKNISSLGGLEKFINLKYLNVSNTNLQKLDVSNFTYLTWLDCSANQLYAVSVENCTSLEYLNCSSNNISSLNLSKNKDLTYLDCSENRLWWLSVSSTSLEYLNCSLNEISDLTFSKNKIKHLICGVNKLSSIDVSDAKTLTELECSSNPLEYIDASNCTELTQLNCMTSGTVLNYLKVNNCISLKTLSCNYSKAKTIEVVGCVALTNLSCVYNNLTSLDVSDCVALTRLYCFSNSLKTLDVGNCKLLTYLDCSSNSLSSLELGTCTALSYLDCSSNGQYLTSLELSNCTSLTYLDCSSNYLTSLDVGNCTALTYLGCSHNPLTSLDVGNCTALISLGCSSTYLKSLDVSSCKELMELSCNECNNLIDLGIKNNTKLNYLNCVSDNVKELDISNCDFDSFRLYAWPGGLKKLFIRKGQSVNYYQYKDNGYIAIDPTAYGTKIIELD